jgi:hypothetical protein
MHWKWVKRRAVICLSISCTLFCTWILAALVVDNSPDAEAHALLAATPPMGWNSWDAYGETVSESDIKANAAWMAKHLKAYGWEYVVVDSGWYVTNHSAGNNAAAAEFSLDAYGRYTPAVNTIPSAELGAGFKPLADYVHSLGLKFGIHILRGIPKEAVRRNLPIAGSSFHAKAAANLTDSCPWNPFNYGLKAGSPAAQAYYGPLLGCTPDGAWTSSKSIALPAIPTGRRNPHDQPAPQVRRHVLSLSPGPAPLDKAIEPLCANVAHLR